MDRYDYLVLGGGSGGIASARRAAQHGAKVALIEGGRVGGTCVNVGCVPKKIMFNVANMAQALREAPDFGFALEAPEVDWPKVKRGRDSYVEWLNSIYVRNLGVDGVELIHGWGQLTDAHTIRVGERSLAAEHILIATGGRPLVPDLPGAELGITSDDFFELEQRPRSVAIVGAGYVAVELGGILRALGSEVTFFIRGSHPLRHFDQTLGGELADAMAAQGIRVHTSARVQEVREEPGGLCVVEADHTRSATFDEVIWAIGRRPNTVGIGLEQAGVRLDGAGCVAVDDFQDTNIAGVHAVGDVTGRVNLTPVAIAAGRHLSDRLFGGQPEARLSYDDIPTVIFSHPPIGTVGMSEAEALDRFGPGAVKVYRSRFANIYHALSEERPRTVMKLVTVGAEERIVGIHVIGMAADELIQGFAVALRMGAKKDDLDRTVAIHPTAAEELVTMR